MRPGEAIAQHNLWHTKAVYHSYGYLKSSFAARRQCGTREVQRSFGREDLMGDQRLLRQSRLGRGSREQECYSHAMYFHGFSPLGFASSLKVTDVAFGCARVPKRTAGQLKHFAHYRANQRPR
jgi:hypothetical protein